MDWNGINEEHIVYFPYDAEKGSEDFNEDDLLMDYTVFGEHLVWKRLANNYPIAYYFPNKKNLHIVQLYMNEILKSTTMRYAEPSQKPRLIRSPAMTRAKMATDLFMHVYVFICLS